MYHFAHQVEGAYVQGLSYYTYEHFIYNETTGELLTNSALDYEVFLAKDIPIDFRVYFRYNSKNPKGVLGSKGNCYNYSFFILPIYILKIIMEIVS